MLFRTLLIFLPKPFLKPVGFGERTQISMRVLPSDLDILWHVNNGMYFSYMDFGRWDATFRNGAFVMARENGWYPVVAGETIKFKKSLKLWDKFVLETEIKGYDEKYFFIQQKFLLKGELMATGLVKIRFLQRKGGTVSTSEILEPLKNHKLEIAGQLSSDWFDLERKHLV